MNDYISKPVKVEHLQDALRCWGEVVCQTTVASPAPEVVSSPAGDRVNLKVLRQMGETFKNQGGAELMTELIEMFCEDTPKMLARMREGIEAGSIDEVQLAAYSLKSNSDTMGANFLGELCVQLELKVKNGSLDGAEKYVEELEREFNLVRQELSQLGNGELGMGNG
jgi:HPt (histidine-containing phosphotransfer) domain-containing protein